MMENKVSTSSASVKSANRMSYALALVKANIETQFRRTNFQELESNLNEYKKFSESHCLRKLEDCRILEIGFGQRPFRYYLLKSLGMDVTAVDIEHPTLGLSDLPKVFRRNGFYRMCKGAIRAGIFDRKIYSDFRRFVKSTFDKKVTYNAEGLVVADSSTEDFWKANPGPFDFIYSEDVFEHVPRANLVNLVRHMSENMTTGGIACVRPMVFTGISGGHHIDWYPATFNKDDVARSTPAWDHLLDDNHAADTYMNKVTRRDYYSIFEEHFEVIHDQPKIENLGAEYLTPELKARLEDYDDYELFSNQVLFVLKKK